VIKTLTLYFLMNKHIAPTALRCVMRLHNLLYDFSGVLAIIVNRGKHPKHQLLRYQEWFLENIQPDWVVIDVGTNTGSMASLMATKARHVYGIEIVPQLVEVARKNYDLENLEFLNEDAISFDYASCQSIDCVTLSNVLEHIESRGVFIHNLLKHVPWRDPSKCCFLIRVPTIERDWLTLYKQKLGVEYRLDRTHQIEYTRDIFFKELGDAGLEIISFDVRFGEFYAVCYGNFE
jgi:2-polyprenyl-3-methyl-5-hydroxy-6-metoxy-1,4-benzoquinol methylase